MKDKNTMRHSSRKRDKQPGLLPRLRHIRGAAARMERTGGDQDRVLQLSTVAEKKHLQEQIAQADRLAAIGEVTAGVAHNFGNVLMGLSAALDVLTLKLSGLRGGEELVQMVTGAQAQISRGTDLIHRMLSLSRGASPHLGSVQLGDLVEDVLALAANHPAANKVDFRTDIPNDFPPLVAAAGQLQEILLNLVLNALQASEPSGRITVAAKRQSLGHQAEISVTDNGCGIPAEDLPRIFDPFFSRRRDGTCGTGLGLSTSLALATQMGGTIRVASSPGRGSTFTLLLPAAEQILAEAA